MSIENPNFIHAMCGVTAGGAPVYNRNRGFAGAIVHNGVGDYTLTLEEALDVAEGLVFATPELPMVGSQLAGIGVLRLSDTQIQVTLLREGAAGAVSAASDAISFVLIVVRLPTSN